MALEPGKKLGPYQIVAPVASDASESYKAADTRLNRTVTIKLLPAHASENPESRQRLEHEIKAVAALNHPHICALYDVGREAETDYVVAEYLEGETLAQRLARSPMEVEEALRVAIPIADALDKAHRQGLTHRGLNPSNVILTESGAKLADFGFARLNEPSSASVSSSLLSTRTSVSPSGAIAPSAAPYLAPEQYAGAEGDARTDIFAFGAVLYEMVTGRPAFEGKTHPLLLAAIQTVDPEPMSKLQPLTPPALEYVVKRCLAKDPRQRLQTARDLLSHLRWIAEGGSQTGIPAPMVARRKKRDRLFWIAAAALFLLVVGLAPSAYRYFEGSPEPNAVHFGIYNMPQTAQAVGGTGIHISPNGRWIHASVPPAGGVYILGIDSVTPKLVLQDHAIFAPFWSPDSRSFAFFEDGKLKTSDISGAPPQILSDAPMPVGGGTWSPDGVIVFTSQGTLYRVLAAGGEPQKILGPDTEAQQTELSWPFFLPDGRHYIFLLASSDRDKSAIYLGSLDSEDVTPLFPAVSRAMYAAPGYILFNRQSAVFAQPFDAETLQLTGEPVRVTDANLNVQTNNLAASYPDSANFEASQTGVLVYRTGSLTTNPGDAGGPNMTMTWFDRSGSAEQVGPPGAYAGVDLDPDGKRFAVHMHEGTGGDSWFYDAGRLQRLTFAVAQDNSMPVWSRDGKRIAFASLRDGKWGIYVKASNGTGTEELLVESEVPKAPMTWKDDDKWLIYLVNDPKTQLDIWMVSLEGKHETSALVRDPGNQVAPVVSPDGKWMAYQSNVTNPSQIFVEPFPDSAGNKFQISTDGGAWPRWRGDSKELYYVLAPNMMATDIRVTGGSVQPSVPSVLFPLRGNPNVPTHPFFYHRYAVTPDGQRFLIPQPANISVGSGGGLSGTIVAFADDAASGTSGITDPGAIRVLLNWPETLKGK